MSTIEYIECLIDTLKINQYHIKVSNNYDITIFFDDRVVNISRDKLERRINERSETYLSYEFLNSDEICELLYYDIDDYLLGMSNTFD